MSLGLFNCRLIQPARDQLFFFAGCLAAPVPVRASSVQSPCDASCSAPTSGRARNASCVFPSQEGFVLVFRGSEAPVGCRRVHPTDSPTNSPEDPPILPIDSAIEPEREYCFQSPDASVHSTLAGILPFGASFLVRDDGGAHLNPALENRVAQFGLSPSTNPGILLLTHAHSKPKNNPAFHRRVACGRFCQRGHETFAPLPFRAVGCIFKGPSRRQSARCLPRCPWLKR